MTSQENPPLSSRFVQDMTNKFFFLFFFFDIYILQKQNGNQDIRKFFTPTSGKKAKKRKDAKEKASSKVVRTKTTDAQTPSRNTAPMGDQSLIILDSDDDDISIPTQTSVVSAVDDDQNRRSSLEDFVDDRKQGPIRKKVLSDITEQNSTRVVTTQTRRHKTENHILRNSGVEKSVPSSTDDDLPDMKSVIRRRPRKRKHLSEENVEHADTTPLNEISTDTPSCSTTDVEVQGRSNATSTPRRVKQEECVTPTSSTSGIQCERSTVERSKVGDSHQVNVIQRPNPTWSCSACTFENYYELPFCEICSTPRKNVSTRSHAKVLKQGNEHDTRSKVKSGSNSTSCVVSDDDHGTAVEGHLPSTGDDIVVPETPNESDTTITDDASTHIDDVTTAVSASTDSDTTLNNGNDILDIDEPVSPVSIRDEPVSPMSIGCGSDVILDPDSPSISDDLFGDCDTDDKQSSTDVPPSKNISHLDNNKTLSNSPKRKSRTSLYHSSRTPVSNLVGCSIVAGKLVAQKDSDEKMTGISIDNDNTDSTEDDANTSEQPDDVILKPTSIRIKRKRKSRHSRGSSSDDTKLNMPTPSDTGITQVNQNTGEEIKEVKSLNNSTTDIDEFSDSDDFEQLVQEMFDQQEDNPMGDLDDPVKQPAQADHPISDSDSEEDLPEPEVYESFLFCCSKYTDRIYLLDQVKCFT